MDQLEQNKPKPPRYFTDKVLATHQQGEVIRKSKDRTFFGYTYEKQGTHPLSLAIDIRTKDGNRSATFFHEISSPIIFDPSGSICFKTSSQEIKIEGRNLEFIYELLMEHRLVWIKEMDDSFPVSEATEPIIESIKTELV